MESVFLHCRWEHWTEGRNPSTTHSFLQWISFAISSLRSKFIYLFRFNVVFLLSFDLFFVMLNFMGDRNNGFLLLVLLAAVMVNVLVVICVQLNTIYEPKKKKKSETVVHIECVNRIGGLLTVCWHTIWLNFYLHTCLLDYCISGFSISFRVFLTNKCFFFKEIYLKTETIAMEIINAIIGALFCFVLVFFLYFIRNQERVFSVKIEVIK